jgi:7,8-dihydropterin-6-yl-methyl-4-(beta-D-ribofuranosyl)aminobenzene 5'-phosphate synthase
MTTITCVVDNSAKPDTHLKTEHGLAFWIEAKDGIVLFDTGQTADVLANNLAELHLDVQDVSAVALSHAHFDHTGGLEALLPGNPNLTIYANTDIFVPKFSFKKGKYKPNGFEFSREDYEQRAEWRLSSDTQEIFPGLWTTGEIIGRDEPEGRSNSHYVLENESYIRDPYRDDMSLVLKTDEGLVVICGCCHAGLLNTLAHVTAQFDNRIIAVLGGTHLMAAEGELLEHVMKVLASNYPDVKYYLNHCTGDSALKALKARFGKRVSHFNAGESIVF